MSNITIIGAGVTGLTIALELASFTNHHITIIAQHIPTDIHPHYTSPFAGANWSSFGTDDDQFTQDLDKAAYIKFNELSRVKGTGVFRVRDVNYVRKSELNGQVKKPWFHNFVTGFTVFDSREVPEALRNEDDPVVAGYSYDTVTITTALYLTWMLQRAQERGVVLIRKRLAHIDQAYDIHHTARRADLVINCAGLLASKLGGVDDDNTYPIRGQIIRVRNNFPHQVCVSTPGWPQEAFYAFPRQEGGGIIGGTFIPHEWSTRVDDDLTERILERAKTYIPELTSKEYDNNEDIDVIETYVGLRPGRKGGVRLERVGNVIHCYGIGGAGYQASYGLAKRVRDLVQAYARDSKL